MAKKSAHYNEKEQKQKARLEINLEKLPKNARRYLESREQNVRTSTLVSYAYDLIVFHRFLSKEVTPPHGIDSVTADDIIAFQNQLAKTNGPASINRKMSTLGGLFTYLVKHGEVEENPVTLVSVPKKTKDKSIITLTMDEVMAMLEIIRNGSDAMTKRERTYARKSRQRNLAFVMLMLTTGIRVSECSGLDLTDVNFTQRSITIVRKGGGQDVLYFDKVMEGYLREYIENERQKYAGRSSRESDREALILSAYGTRMRPELMEELVRRYASYAIHGKKVTPHKFRSTYGTELYRVTGDIRLVAEVLGHEDINTTIKYYAAMDDERKRSVAGLVKYEV